MYSKREQRNTHTFALILGAMKCGTSSLFYYLSQHSQILGSVVDEPNYLCNQPLPSLAGYKTSWPLTESSPPFLIEASTAHTKKGNENIVIKNLRTMGLKPFFVYIVRNPFDRIESHFNFRSVAPATSLNGDLTSGGYLETSNYYQRLSPYANEFGDERILVLDFDVIKSSPADAASAAFQFLGVQDESASLDYSVKNATVQVSSLERWLMRNNLTGIRHAFPLRVRKAVQKHLRRNLPSSKRLLTPEERNTIHQRLSNDMIKFGNRFSVDIEKWGFSR